MTPDGEMVMRDPSELEAEIVRLRGELLRRDTTIATLLHKEEQRTAREAENHRRLAELEMLVTKDPTTGLLNRRGLDEVMGRYLSQMARAKEHGGVSPPPATIVFIDLDRFKPVNDLISHRAGDIMLMKFGSALRRVLWESDYIARVGGDEFVVVLKSVRDRKTAEKVVEKIHRAVNEITIEGADQVQLEILYRATGRRKVLGFSAGYFVITNAQLNVSQLIDLAEHDVPKFSALRPARGDYRKT